MRPTSPSRWTRRAATAAAAALIAGACAGGEGERGARRAAEPGSLGAGAAAILTRAIRIRTVNPPGDERPLAEYYVSLLRAAGVEARVIETPAGSSAVGRAAAWARLPGSGRRRPLVLLSHLDVIPALAEGWTVEPWAGEWVDGHVIGRGALDAKGISVVHLLTLTTLAKHRTALDRDIVFLATPDEETGGRFGAGYLVRERPELLRGAEYLLTEGGGVLRRDEDRRPVWGVTITEKNPCWLRLVSRGTPGHSSVPPRDAAVPRLVAALERVHRIEMPIHVVPDVAAMFADLAPLADEEDRVGFADLATALEADAAFRSRFLADRNHAALVRNTVTTTVLEASSHTNVLPEVAVAHLDARLLPGEKCEAFEDQVRSVIADPGLSLERLLSFASRRSSPDTPLFRAIERVAAATDVDAVVIPRMIAGFTDAHYFRELGITAYGFVPRWQHVDELRGIHGPNERISLANLERGVTTLVAILRELDRVEAEETDRSE